MIEERVFKALILLSIMEESACIRRFVIIYYERFTIFNVNNTSKHNIAIINLQCNI